MCSHYLFHIYFMKFFWTFLLKSSRTLTQVTVEGHNEVRGEKEKSSVEAEHPRWLMGQMTFGFSSTLQKWNSAKSSHIFQNFTMIWITWGSCTSEYKFPDSFQIHYSEFSEGSLESYICTCLTRLPGDFYHWKVWETMSWTTLTAIQTCKSYHPFVSLITYFNWICRIWSGDSGRKKKFFL